MRNLGIMADNSEATKALQLLLIPVMRFCLRHRIGLMEIVAAVKRALVATAREEILKESPKVNASRLSVVTGIHRNEIPRLLGTDADNDSPAPSLAERVLGTWVSDRRFSDRNGGGLPLHYRGEQCEFHKLVRSVSKNINPATVLFELTRNGRVEKRGDYAIPVRSVSQFGEGFARGFVLASRDVEVVVKAVEENVLQRDSAQHMHFHTYYDNIYAKDLPVLRQWLIEKGREFHRELRSHLSSFDKDTNVAIDDGAPAGVKISVLSVSLAEIPPGSKERE